VREAARVADAALGLVEEGAHRGLSGRRRPELRRVQVQIQAQDDRTVEPKLGEATKLITVGSAYLHLPQGYPAKPCAGRPERPS